MKSLTITALAFAVVLPILTYSDPAAAKLPGAVAGKRQRVDRYQVADQPKWLTPPGGLATRARFYVGRNPTDMARRWCGRFMRMISGQDPGPSADVARYWARLGRPARPGPDVVVVWRHHVGVISRVTGPGRAVVISGNTGEKGRRRVLEEERSLEKVIAFRQL